MKVGYGSGEGGQSVEGHNCGQSDVEAQQPRGKSMHRRRPESNTPPHFRKAHGSHGDQSKVKE